MNHAKAAKYFGVQVEQLHHLLCGGTLTKEQVEKSGLGEGVLIEDRCAQRRHDHPHRQERGIMSEETKSDLMKLADNAWDIGTVSGVLQGIEMTPILLPNQKEAIASARKAIERIEARNKRAVEAITHGEWSPKEGE